MNDFLEELGALEISPEETRELLRRHAIEEFGGTDTVRLRDVSEVTGASTELLARMIAELRGESWPEWRSRIEETIRTHAQRLASVEAKGQALVDDGELFDRVERGRLRREEERRKKEFSAVEITIGTVLFAAFVLYILYLVLQLSTAAPVT